MAFDKQKQALPWMVAIASALMMLFLSYQFDKSLGMQYQLDLIIQEQDSTIEVLQQRIRVLEGDSLNLEKPE